MGETQAAVTKTLKNNNRTKEAERQLREYEDFVKCNRGVNKGNEVEKETKFKSNNMTNEETL